MVVALHLQSATLKPFIELASQGEGILIECRIPHKVIGNRSK
jgi:hypothetical protein